MALRIIGSSTALAAALVFAAGGLGSFAAPASAQDAAGADMAQRHGQGTAAAAIPGTNKDSDRLNFSEEEWGQLYDQAVADAIVAEPHEVTGRLFPIGESNPHLVWRDGPDGPQVLTASWVSSWKMARTVDPNLPGAQAPASIEEAQPFVGETGTTPSGGDGQPNYFWVTPVPQFQAFCRGLGLEGRDLRIRLAQYLGLPIDSAIGPYAESRFVVELWVSPEDLFRPCADPAINDTACALDEEPLGRYAGAAALPGDHAYRAWFEERHALSYEGDWRFPWTRLGYTYDWGDSDNEIGGSEYVIYEEAEFEIANVHTPDDYCGVD